MLEVSIVVQQYFSEAEHFSIPKAVQLHPFDVVARIGIYF